MAAGYVDSWLRAGVIRDLQMRLCAVDRDTVDRYVSWLSLSALAQIKAAGVSR